MKDDRKFVDELKDVTDALNTFSKNLLKSAEVIRSQFDPEFKEALVKAAQADISKEMKDMKMAPHQYSIFDEIDRLHNTLDNLGKMDSNISVLISQLIPSNRPKEDGKPNLS